MKPDVALQAMFDRFVGRFVLPLVQGGTTLVSYPIGPGALGYFAAADPSDRRSLATLSAARRAVLRQLLSHPSSPELGLDDLALAGALHNVLLGSHRELSEGFRGKARWKRCMAFVREHLGLLSPCSTAAQALERHSLLHGVFDLSREDSLVRTWRTVRRFPGQKPPPRTYYWAGLRQVQSQRTVAELEEVIVDEEARELFSATVEHSPLTCLWEMPHGRHRRVFLEPFRWSQPVGLVLSQASLCRAVTYRHLELGLPVVTPSLAQAMMTELEKLEAQPQGSAEAAVRLGLQYLIHLQLTHCWTSPRDHITSPLDHEWQDEEEERSQRFLCAWLVAALDRADRWGAPLPAHPELSHKELVYREAARRLASPLLDEATRQLSWMAGPPAVGPHEGETIP